MSMNNSSTAFFKEVYANYNQVWQQILKLPLHSTNLVARYAFEKVLKKTGIDVESPYCLFLLHMCQKTSTGNTTPMSQPGSISNFSSYQVEVQAKDLETQSVNEVLIDYKLFLNSAIKALSQEDFNNETFIIDMFWKAKFQQSETSVSIEQFNQTFYQYFNKEHRLLSIEYVEQITNECFSYLLRKNRKQISKRNFRKVARRQFKDVFNLIILNFKPQSLGATGKTQSSNSGYIQTTCYPDSLDTRSQLRSNASKSLYETSTFHHMNSRSKSSASISMSGTGTQQQLNQVNEQPKHQGVPSHDPQAFKAVLVSERRFDAKVQGCRLLCYSLEKVGCQYAGRIVFSQLKKVLRMGNEGPKQENPSFLKPRVKSASSKIARKHKHNSGQSSREKKSSVSKKRIQKENLIPIQATLQGPSTNSNQYTETMHSNNEISKMEQTIQSSLDGRARNPLQERQTFSFNNANYQTLQKVNAGATFDDGARISSAANGIYRDDLVKTVNTIEQAKNQNSHRSKGRKPNRVLDLEDQQHQNPYKGLILEANGTLGYPSGQNENLATILNHMHTNSLQYSVTPSNSNKPSNNLLFSQDRYSNRNYEDLIKATSSTTNNLRKSMKCETQRQEIYSNQQSSMKGDKTIGYGHRASMNHGDFHHGQVDLEIEDEDQQMFSEQPFSDNLFSDQNASQSQVFSDNQRCPQNVSMSQNDQSLRELEQRLEDVKSSNPHSLAGKSARRFSQNPIPKNNPPQQQVRRSEQFSQGTKTYSQLNFNDYHLNNPAMIMGGCELAQRKSSIQNNLPQYQQAVSSSQSGIEPYSQASEVINAPLSRQSNQESASQKKQLFDFEDYQEAQINLYHPATQQSYDKQQRQQVLSHHQLVPHTLQTQQQPSTIHPQTIEASSSAGKYRKSKELVYFEKKYKKSKDKLRRVIHENVTEKTKNQALEQCNQALQDRLEQMNQMNHQLEQGLVERDELSRHLQIQLRQVEFQIGLKLLHKLTSQREAQVTRTTIRKWKEECFRQQTKDINVKKIGQFIRQRTMNRFYQMWVRYTINRQTRKEKRKMLKTQVKVLKMIFRRKQLTEKRKAFGQWKGPAIKASIIGEVHRDIQFAQAQVKTMRFIMSFNKLDMLVQKRLYKDQMQAFLTLTRFTMHVNSNKTQHSKNKSFTYQQPQTTSHLTNYQQSIPPQYPIQSASLYQPKRFQNLASSQQKNKNAKSINNHRGYSCENNRNSVISPQTRAVSHFDCNQLQDYRISREEEFTRLGADSAGKFYSTEVGRFESQRKRESDSHKKTNDYSLKMGLQRQQAQYLEGIEKVYQINRKLVQKIKNLYLERWRAAVDLMKYDENNGFSPRREGGLICDSSATDFLENSNDNALATANFQNQQDAQQTTPPLNQPCYYKTNEGFFYPNNQNTKARNPALLSPSRHSSSSKRQTQQTVQKQILTGNGSATQLTPQQTPQNALPKPYPHTKAPIQNRLDKCLSNRSSKKTLRSVSSSGGVNSRQQRDTSTVNESVMSSQLADMSNLSGSNQELSEAIAYLKAKVTTVKPAGVGNHRPSLR